MDAGQEERVLLPGKKVPAGTKEGDRFQVFIYKDSSDRLIATTDRPKAAVGELAVMKVAQVPGSVHFWTGGWKKICSFLIKNRPKNFMKERKFWQQYMLIKAAGSAEP